MRKTVNVEEFVQNVKKTVIAVIVEKIVRNAKTTANVEEIVQNAKKTVIVEQIVHNVINRPHQERH